MPLTELALEVLQECPKLGQHGVVDASQLRAAGLDNAPVGYVSEFTTQVY